MKDDKRFTSKQKMILAITGTMFIMVLALLVVIILIDTKDKAEPSSVSVTDTETGIKKSGDTAQVQSEQTDQSEQSAVTASAKPEDTVEEGLSYSEKWQEGYIRYDGKVYKYNSSIRTFLIMGIDSDDVVKPAPDMISGGQADALFLMVIDDSTGSISVIAINRNTMTDIKLCDRDGRSLGTFTAQICLQHAYGDGMRLSCQRTVDAVSYLFYNIPIAGYFAMNMGGLSILNDAVGGVSVTLDQDFVIPATGAHIIAGEPYLLKGKDTYSFIRYRDTAEFDSASMRMQRHEIYLAELLKQMERTIGNSKSKALEIFELIEDYSESSLIFADIAEDIGKYGFSDDRMYSLKGETKQGTTFEEFFYEESELYRLILKIFYDIVANE